MFGVRFVWPTNVAYGMTDASSRSSTVPYSTPTLVGALCIVLIMTGTLVSACDSGGSNGNSAESTDVLIPLEVGNEWIAETDRGRRVEASVSRDSVVEITEERQQEDFTFSIQIEKHSDGIRIGEDLSTDDDSFVLRYPIEDGATYEYTDPGGDETFEVSVTRQSITVPAGSFDCLMYTIQEEGDEDSQRAWIKPGTGPVRLQDIEGEGTLELISTNAET